MDELKPEDIKPDTFPKANKVSVLAGIPEYLKDRKNYPKVQKALLETLATTHSHSDMIEWAGCFQCQRKMHDHAEMVRKLGFLSPAQYFAWKKVMQEIERRVPLRQLSTSKKLST